jgi:hypothetical protein
MIILFSLMNCSTLLDLVFHYFICNSSGTIISVWDSPFLAHLAFRPSELLSSLFVRRLSSVTISHFNLLLRNHWANCNQTLVEWSLDGPLPKLCPVINVLQFINENKIIIFKNSSTGTYHLQPLR